MATKTAETFGRFFAEGKKRLPSQEDVDRVVEGHQLAQSLLEGLMSHPGLRFSSLTVRPAGESIILEGVLESNDSQIDVQSLVRGIAGQREVIDEIVDRTKIGKPR